MCLLSKCCTSSQLLQSTMLPSSASCQNQSRHLTESFNARRFAIDTFLFRIVPCNDMLSFISDYTRPSGKCRILSCQNSRHSDFHRSSMSLRFGRERNVQNHIHSIRKPLKELDGWISGSILKSADLCLRNPCFFCQFLLRHIL